MDKLVLRSRVCVPEQSRAGNGISSETCTFVRYFLLSCAQRVCNWITWMGTNPACIIRARVRVPGGEFYPSARKWNVKLANAIGAAMV